MNDFPIEKPEPLESNSLANLIAPKIEDLGPEFDVFDYAEKYGRENLLLNVSHPIFHYKNINKFIDFYNFPDFINQLRIGYTSSPDAFYHSVNKPFKFFNEKIKIFLLKILKLIFLLSF